MSDYKYIGGENPMFMSDHSKLEDTAVRFKVMGFRWMEADRQFQILATLAAMFSCALYYCFYAFIILLSTSNAEEFIYNGFTDADQLTLEGEASIDRNRIGLTSGLNVGGFGHAFYKYPLNFRNNSSSHNDPSFATTFVFTITTWGDRPQEAGSDGIAFVLSSTNKLINHSLGGQYLGLFNASNTSQNILAIELDTFMNPDLNDMDDNHVGIDVTSLISINSHTAGFYTSDGGFQFLRLANGRSPILQLWVDYDGKAHQLNVTLGLPYSPKPEYPLLSSIINLSSLLPSSAYIGFSASINSPETRHFILGWSFKENGRVPPLNYSAPNDLETYGWGGNNFAPPPPPQLNSHQVRKPSLQILLPIVITSVVLLLVVAFLGSYYCKKRWKKAGSQEDWEMKCRPPSFIYKDLYNATSGFSDKMLLGKGGFGKRNVAIKRISPESKQGMKEFMSEVAILGNVRHQSLVQLLGYCMNKHELLLVYDYMPNGSLDKYLYGRHKLALGWSQRFRIIKGVACGLVYLHEEWECVIIHRDIKSSNVLLDEEMNGRLGVDAHTTHVAGTYGYIAPELARLGKSTKGTDVFAFGVFMMEVACGKRPIEVNSCGEPQALADHVLNAWQRSSIINSIDPSLEDHVAEEVELVLKLGLLCSHSSSKVRPSMRLVMQYLEREATLQDFAFSFFSINEANNEVYGQHIVSNPSSNHHNHSFWRKMTLVAACIFYMIIYDFTSLC
uniref:non-specific serine/threonine protein kinase n=1 Tax=Oryza meridionalis TaxID=40149 RepID=A0A0E0DNH1_9ORYZ